MCNKIIQSKVFKITSYIVILINAIILGWSKYRITVDLCFDILLTKFAFVEFAVDIHT